MKDEVKCATRFLEIDTSYRVTRFFHPSAFILLSLRGPLRSPRSLRLNSAVMTVLFAVL